MKVVGGKEFFRGHKEIAQFLGVHPKTVQRWIKAGKIPVRRDGLGRWVLSSWGYDRELRRDDEYRKGSE